MTYILQAYILSRFTVSRDHTRNKLYPNKTSPQDTNISATWLFQQWPLISYHHLPPPQPLPSDDNRLERLDPKGCPPLGRKSHLSYRILPSRASQQPAPSHHGPPPRPHQPWTSQLPPDSTTTTTTTSPSSLTPQPPRWPSGRSGVRIPPATAFSGSSHTSDFKIGTPVATLPDASRYRVIAGTGWTGVSILWLGELGKWICNLYLSVAGRTIVWADPSLRYTSMLLGQPTN